MMMMMKQEYKYWMTTRKTAEEYKYASFTMKTAFEIQVSDCNGNYGAEYK